MDTSSKQDDPGYTILLAVFNIAAYIVEPLLFFLFNHKNFTNAMVFFSKLLLTYLPLQFFLVGSQDLIWIVYLCAFADSIVSQFFNPAQTAIIPMLVEDKDLLPANSLNSMSQELTRLIGPSLGGLLFGLFGIGSVITLDILSFLYVFFINQHGLLPGPALSQSP